MSDTKNGGGIHADTLIAFFALIVSTVSIIFSTCESKKTSKFNEQQQEQAIKHDKLSVRPLLEFDAEYIKSSDWTGISLKNKGIGPAIIKKVEKNYNNRYFKNWGDLTIELQKNKSFFWKKKEPFRIELTDGQALTPNEEIKLWFIETSEVDLDRADTILNSLQLHVLYTDFYGDTLHAFFPQRN